MATTTKRGFVPSVLYAELTEYANVIRVLRTARALDLTTHLLQHAAKHKGKERGKDGDTWTSWPLIDCPVPEWSLEDEIQQLGDMVVRQVAKIVRARDVGEVQPTHNHDTLDSDSDREGLSPAGTRRLVLHTGIVLAHTLNLMADQRPSAPGSMQNRLWAMNWADVISLLSVGGIIDPAVIARAERRLERIYGSSTTKAVERLKLIALAKARFSTFTSIQEDQLLAPPVYPRRIRDHTKGRRLHKNRAKSCAIIDTDTDVDAS